MIIDELGYIPFPKSGGALLFHLISIVTEATNANKETEAIALIFKKNFRFTTELEAINMIKQRLNYDSYLNK